MQSGVIHRVHQVRYTGSSVEKPRLLADGCSKEAKVWQVVFN
jgi:hypothetical protein